MGDQSRADARLLQPGLDEQRAQPVAAQRDGADDAIARLTDEHVALGHALADLVGREVGDDQVDRLRRVIAAVGNAHRVLHQRADRGDVIGSGVADHEIFHGSP